MAEEQKDDLKEKLKVQRAGQAGATRTQSRLGALLPPIDQRYNKSDVIDCIYMCCGVQTQICIMLDCTQRQFQYWLRKHPDAQADLAAAKEYIVAKAEEVIIGAMGGDDKAMALDAAKHIMKIYGKQQPTQMVNVQINTSKEEQVKAIFGLATPQDEYDEK